MNANSQNIFQFNQSANVRVYADEKGEYWFLANDVCTILGYANARDTIAKHCRLKGVVKHNTLSECDVANRDISSKARKYQEMTYINEPNLYRLIIKSRKPEAEAFEEWVMEEVLPTIRKTGSYQLTAPKLTPAQKQAIQAAVQQRHHRTGEHWQDIYRKLHAFLHVNSYHEIPANDFQAALNFLVSIENAPIVAPAQEFNQAQIEDIARVLLHAQKARRFIRRYLNAFESLGLDQDGAMWSFVHETESMFAPTRQSISQMLNRASPISKTLLSRLQTTA